MDISVIIPAHHEGRLAHPTMRSAFRAADMARKNRVGTEIIVVLDKPDKKTEDYFSRYEGSPNIRLETVDFGDLGFTRNFGVKAASGRYVTFLDADNLLGQNWIYASFLYLENSDRDVIAHPEYFIVFETENLLWRQTSSDDPECDIGNMLADNYWDANCTAKREILLKYPYQATTSTKGFGFEDWHFNCITLADGIGHKVVPGTVNFMRKKISGSLLAHSLEANRVVRPNRLFDPDVFSAMLKP